MDDAAKVLTAKFNISVDTLKKISDESTEVNSWLTVLGAYILDNDKKQEEQTDNEALLRKQRLNAEHQLGQLEKQLISCNVKLSKYEKDISDVRNECTRKEELLKDTEKKLHEASDHNKVISEENEQLKHKSLSLENEKCDFSSMLEKKNSEIERLNEEWQEMSKKLAEANKAKYEMQYKMEEIKNSDIRKEYREKRLEQEKSMLVRQLENANSELRTKTDTLNNLQKEKSANILDLQAKYDTLHHENIQLKTNLETSRKKCEMQESKIEGLMSKLKCISEENVEAINNMQQELSAQTKLVQLYKDDRDHAKEKLEEVTGAVSELQIIVKELSEEKTKFDSTLQANQEASTQKIEELEEKLKQATTELSNANDLLKVSRKSGSKIVSEAELANLSPLAAATSAILKKGLSLTQIYTEYVKTSDELMLEKEENSRLKIYMEQILQEVEEKAPLLMRQKEDYEHGKKTVEAMAQKLEENIKECQKLHNLSNEYERKVDFHKREEKRLHSLCVDLSQQVRVLLKEVEEARGGHVSSSNILPELLSNAEESNTSCGQVISEHLVTFKTIEELQSQNQRLLLTVRELSEEQEKLEQEGGPEIIQELKRKIENAQQDLETLRENHKTQDEIMHQLTRQRDMYKVLCQQGGVMVGEISSTSAFGSQTIGEIENELTKCKAELEASQMELKKLKDDFASKERKLNEMNSKQGEELAAIKVDCDRLKNKVEYGEEKYSIQQTTSEGYRKEAKALEDKCKAITEALTKARVEAEKYKQDYHGVKEKLVSAEVNVKSLEVEKNLIKEAEKRIMQENQSLLDQQHSQNVLLSNLQTIQNNLERQEFQTRNTLGKQVDNLQREIKALRRQRDMEGQQLKSSGVALENDLKDLQVKIGIEVEKKQKLLEELESSKQAVDELEIKCKELELQNKATEERLESVLTREASGKAKEDYQREMERYKTKVRELELSVGNTSSGRKAVEDQLEVTKKHLEQFKEICAASEVALSKMTKDRDEESKNYEDRLKSADETIKRLRSELGQHITEKGNIKRASEEAERVHQYTLSELKGQMAPLERRFQEVTRALVNAKEVETEAVKESQLQANLAKETQDKYEKEIVLHGKDVELLTHLKDELKELKNRYGGIEEREKEMKQTLENNERLMEQMKDHHHQEIRKGEVARKDLISQNGILHGQVEKLSAQLAVSKTQVRSDEKDESFADKSIEEVYELLRFVRREKEIAETKSEASETESMRYRQRAEHLQRDLDESKAALELELERTKGHMLTEEEHKDILDKIKKSKEFEEMNKHMVKEKELLDKKLKDTVEKNKKLEADFKPLQTTKKALEAEKSSWLAEKTALKQEIDRWTHRTNQLMAQCSKVDSEEIKKLQANKVHSEKAITGLQDEIRRTKQQLDGLKRESLKLKSENNELQSKVTSLQNDVKSSGTNNSAADMEHITNVQKEKDEMKKSLDIKMVELAEKSRAVLQLKKIARKYKVQCDELQKMLKEHNINYENPSNPSSSAANPTTPTSETQTAGVVTPVRAVTPVVSQTEEEKNKMEEQLSESYKKISSITKELNDLQALYNEEKSKCSSLETKYEESHKLYQESERKINELKKSFEALQAECNEKEKEKEKNRKLLKTAKDKITTLTKNKDSNNREMESLRNKVDELQKALEQSKASTIDQANSFNAVRVQLDVKIINLEKQVEELLADKRSLMERLEEVQNKLDNIQEQKKAAGKLIKVSGSKQKSRIQVVSRGTVKSSKGDPNPGSDASTNTPLTATVRPSATPSSQATSKFHQQSTRTASIRPLTHSAPTAMISPTVPVTQPGAAPTLVASVAALPMSVSVTPQVAEIQGQDAQGRQLSDRSGSSFKAPVARVQVQAQGRDEEQLEVPYADDDLITGQQPVPSSSGEQLRSISTFGKRMHIEISGEDEDEDDIALLEDAEPEQPKRQRVEIIEEEDQLMTDSQEGQLEDELLGEVEDGDDDVISDDLQSQQYSDDMSSQAVGGSREAQLQIERSLQPSPQELLRQGRVQGRARNQLPSISLLPGQPSSGFYEETDDSTVPSTPTLYMPKRTDGFAEAVSSPVVRFPSFSFSANEQPPGSVQSSLEHSGNLHETRVDLMSSEDQANVPQTPLSVVPSVLTIDHMENRVSGIQDGTSSQRDERRGAFGEQFFPEDNGQEQNVPQQIDLTEDDDEEDEIDLAQASEVMGDVVADGEDGVDLIGGDGDLVDLDDDEESEDTDDEDDIDSESGDSDEMGRGKGENEARNNEIRNRDDVVELEIPDEENFGEEEVGKAEEVAEEKAAESIPEDQNSAYGDQSDNLNVSHNVEPSDKVDAGAAADPEQRSGSSELKEEDEFESGKSDEIEKAKPVRITRTTRGGARPRIHRNAPSTLAGRMKKISGKTKK